MGKISSFETGDFQVSGIMWHTLISSSLFILNSSDQIKFLEELEFVRQHKKTILEMPLLGKCIQKYYIL